MTSFRFQIARLMASLYRLSLLRLARIVFQGVEASTILTRSFYGRRIFLDVSRSSGEQLLWLQGKRYIKERSLLEALVRPNMVIVDVGANIGYYALMFASLLNGKGHVVCLEPDPDNLRQLRMNVSANHLEDIVTIKPMAAGDCDGTINFEAGSNGRVMPNGSITVSIARIDSLGLSKVDFLKVDVEGYEGSVLDGAKDTIRKCHPILFLEIHPGLLTNHTHDQIISFIRKQYASLKAYRPARGNMLTRLLRDYGILNPVLEENISGLARELEAGAVREPRWIVAHV